jgi:hypothetical protein
MVPYTERGLLSVALKNASNYLRKYQAITDSHLDTIFKKISTRKKMKKKAKYREKNYFLVISTGFLTNRSFIALNLDKIYNIFQQ